MAQHAALEAALQPHVDDGSVPGMVAAVATADDEQVVVLGRRALDGPAMTRDSIFRLASITKPITAAAAVLLVERGVLGLDDPVAPLLPELAEPRVLRSPTGPIDDTVAADRPITLRHLLTFTAGHGFPSNFSAPVAALVVDLMDQDQDQPGSAGSSPLDGWMQRLARVPMVHQPGEGWTYHTGSDILGVLIARASGRPLADFFREELFEPLGMADTGFHLPLEAVSRLATLHRPGEPGPGDAATVGGPGLTVVEEPAGRWSTPPPFPSGAGGLVSTVDDWLAFGRMLLGRGLYRGRRVLTEDSVAAMTTDALDQATRRAGRSFLEGQGWGYGGSVDIAVTDPWTEPGRYGWVGGTGTSAHVSFARGRVMVLATQVEMTGPTTPDVMRSFWTATAG